MRIAFVSGNIEHLPDPVAPLGLLYVMAATPAGHEKKLVDLCFEKDPIATLGTELSAFRPDVVAVGMRNIQNSDYSGTSTTIAHYAAIVEAARKSSAKVVLGGSGFSVIPRALMQRLAPDFGIAGEAEGAWPQLVAALATGSNSFGHIGGLHWFRRGELVVNPPPPAFLDLDALPAPDRTLLDPRYATENGIANVQTKRGCPLHCDYCTYPVIEGRAIRRREPSRVVDELFRIVDEVPGTNHVFIVDSVFNLPPRHAKAICREMIARGWAVPWTAYANPLGFDQELAELMAQARCAGLEIGSDSGVDAVLDRLKKGFDTGAVRSMSRLCKQAGVRDCHTFILATQGETLDDVRRTLDFVIDLDPFAAILMTWVDDEEAMDPSLAASRRAFRDEVRALIARKQEEFPRWIIPGEGKNFDRRMFRALRRFGLAGPLWQHIQAVDDPDARSVPRLGAA